MGTGATLEVAEGKILSESPTYSTRFWLHVYGRGLKKPSICPWVASRAVWGEPRAAQVVLPRQASRERVEHERQPRQHGVSDLQCGVGFGVWGLGSGVWGLRCAVRGVWYGV